MKVQRLSLSGPDHQVAGVSWLLLDDNFLPVIPVQEFLSYLHNLERSPNTIRSYAHHLKLYWQYLTESQLDWSKVGLDELAAFVAWLRNPLPGIISLQPRLAKRSESTINTIVAAGSAKNPTTFKGIWKVKIVRYQPVFRPRFNFTRRAYSSFTNSSGCISRFRQLRS